MRSKNQSDNYLFIGNYYPKDAEGNPVSINWIWHKLLEDDSPDILSKDIISAALHSGRDLIRVDNLVKLRNLCSLWSNTPVKIEDLIFTREDLVQARIDSGLDPSFFVKKRTISDRHREARSLCQLIGSGGDSPEWTEDLRKAAKEIADKMAYTSATKFLRKHRYVWDGTKGCYNVPNEKSRNSLIKRNAGRTINWVNEGGDIE